MKRIYFILVTTLCVAFTSCTNDEFVGGEDHGTPQAMSDAITFGSGFKALTRADKVGADAATLLGNAFKVYGVKSNRTTATNYDKVFPNYTVQFATDKQGNTEYNDGWYYDGIGSQTIRYWDYSSARYHFVAGSPVANFTFALKDDATKDIEKATVTGLGGRLNHSTTVASNTAAVYIADPVVMTKPTGGAKYGEVKFTFHSMQSKVRVGIYETIPGYKITSISFYNNASTPVASDYITLNCATDNYFQGGSSVEGIVTYNWTTPSYTLAYSTEDSKKPTMGKYWEGGQFASGVPATTSAATNLYGSESHMGSDGYFIVMPTPSTTAAAPLTLKCDYVLKSLDDVDEIHVTGATATIPETYTKWAPNTAYTYIFKISNNTNGTTGTGNDPAGLYPITFDAAVVDIADQKIGTETTVSTPSITVSQNGNVVDSSSDGYGIKFVAGSVEVKAMNGTTDITSTISGANGWYYVELDGATYDYSKDYEHLGANGAATTWTNQLLTTVSANKTYVIKAVNGENVAYFVLVVGAAETGPNN